VLETKSFTQRVGSAALIDDADDVTLDIKN
jgi:hypothetical protein